MKKVFLFASAAVALLATGCSNDLVTDNSAVDNTGKERIILGAGDDQAAFLTRAGFTNTTRIVARYVSDSREGSDADKIVRTVLLASAEESTNTYSKVSYADGKTRYWDDAYGRKSILSVYAVAIPNKNDGSETSNLKETVLKGADTWTEVSASDDNNISWTVATTQTTTTLENEDLTYSNNIQQTGKKGVYTWDYSTGKYPEPTYNAETGMNSSEHTYGTDPVVTDGRLYFTQKDKKVNEALTTDPGHFDRGQMEFKHALSRIRVNLVHGEGYTSTISLTGNLQLNNMPSKGTLNIKEGSWTLATSDGRANVNMTKVATMTGKDLTYEAQVLPGYVFADDDVNAMQFTISNNTYYITNKMLRAALKDKTGVTADYNMLQGNRYIFDITVAKSKIQNITATIVPWNEVTAANTNVDNSHVTFTFYGGKVSDEKCTDVKLWKYAQSLTDITTGDSYTTAPAVANTAYSAVAGFEKVGETSTYTTSEYYNDNKTAYHFRSTNEATALDVSNKTFTMNSGSTDYHWGAPMKAGLTSDKLPYSLTDGYLSSIEKGIVAASTESNINLTEVHMMSQIVVKLTSIPSQVDKLENAKVTLTGAKVTLTKLSNSGTVDMGSGLIAPSTTYNNTSEQTVTENAGEYSCTINVVPQTLVRGTGESDDDYVGITIKTTDNNEYYIIKRLSEITATSVGSEITNMQTASQPIIRWFPGHKYTYTFNITKTEIKNITATIVPWNDVTGANTELDLEK